MPRIASSSTCTPFLLDQLAEVDDGRLVAGEERREPRGVAVVGQPLARVARVRRVVARLLDQRRERLVARAERELVDVDAGRHLVDAVDVPDDVLEHLADVRRADVRRLRGSERLARPSVRAPAGRASSTRARSRAP